MPSQKPQKIDLNADYPCPCGRKGRIEPITLTEAFGCTRCQQIFVVEQSGYVLEQLSSTYPYKKAWHWTGFQWVRAHQGIKDHYLQIALIVLGSLVVWLLFAIHTTTSGLVLWTIVVVLLVILLIWMTRPTYRR